MKRILIPIALVVSIFTTHFVYSQEHSRSFDSPVSGIHRSHGSFDNVGDEPPTRSSSRHLPKRTFTLAAEDMWDSLFHDGGYESALDNGSVLAIASNGDDLYLAGSFQYFDGRECYNIVRYNKGSGEWTELGYGFSSRVTALAVHDGKLYAGGVFTRAGFGRSTPMSHIAEWNGSSWKQIGGGTNGIVNSIAFMGSDMIIGGDFTKAGTVDVSNIAKWDGSKWSDMNSSLNGPVNCLYATGDSLFVGGDFYDNATGLRSIAMYRDDSWENVGHGFTGEVNAITMYQDKLWVGGEILWYEQETLAGLATWDGNLWDPVAPSVQGLNPPLVRSFLVRNNSLYIGGNFSHVAGVKARSIIKYSGGTFSKLSAGVYGQVSALGIYGDDLYVGGNFMEAGGAFRAHVAKLSPADAWQSSDAFYGAYGGYNTTSTLAAAVTDRYVFIGGEFVTVEDKLVNNVAMWDKVSRQWSALGKGVDGEVRAITVDGAKVYVGGSFYHAGDSIAGHIACWDMEAKKWIQMGDGSSYRFINSIAADESGVYAGVYSFLEGNGYDHYIGRWDGTKWIQLDGAIDGTIGSIVKTGDSLYIGGYVYSIDGVPYDNIALHTTQNGWEPLGDGLSGYVSAIVIAGKDLYAGGYFGGSGATTELRGIGRWDGNSWNALDGGMDEPVRALAWDGSSLYAGGFFTKAGSTTVSTLAKWDGNNWSDVGGGGTDYAVYALATDKKSLYVSGGFTTVGYDFLSYRFAILHFATTDVKQDGKKETTFTGQNYPNPFASETVITYSLKHGANVKVEIYNALGEKVKTVHNEFTSAGDHQIVVDASDLSSGTYLYRFESGETIETKMMQVVK
jgi:hypothetical protein